MAVEMHHPEKHGAGNKNDGRRDEGGQLSPESQFLVAAAGRGAARVRRIGLIFVPGDDRRYPKYR